MELEEVSESDYENGPPCKYCGHEFLDHDDEWGSCGALGKTDTLHDVCNCPGYDDEDWVEPYFQCVCGMKAYPLTDDTECNCGDIYLQEWARHPAL